jgi:predicted LPLAT superfamily acyltransferase
LRCLVVDDGSDAGTQIELTRLAQRHSWIQVDRLERNAGKGAALKRGYRLAADQGFTHCVQLDADGQHSAEDVPAMLDAAEQDPGALILGDPIFDGISRARRYGRWVSYFWVRVETLSFSVRDPLCGFRCIPLEPTLRLLERVSCGNRMDFDPELVVRLIWSGVPISHVPCRVRYESGGISHFDVVWDNVRMSWLHARLFFAMPRHFVGGRLARRKLAEGNWHTQQERGSMWGMRFMAWLYRTVGGGVARLFLYPVVAYFFAMDPSARRASRAYFERLYSSDEGKRALGSPPSLLHMWRHFFAFGGSVLDRVGFFLGRRDDFELTISGGEHLARIVEGKRGCLILGCHLGSFDSMRLVANIRSPLRVRILMYIEHAQRINRLFSLLDTQLADDRAVRVMQIEEGSFAHTLELKKAIEDGEVVAVLGDRLYPNERRRVSRVDFLGTPALLPQGPLLLAAAIGCPVLFMVGLHAGDGRYEIHVEPFAESVSAPRHQRDEAIGAYVQRYADQMAKFCARAPYQWFNFYDFWEDSGAPSDE